MPTAPISAVLLEISPCAFAQDSVRLYHFLPEVKVRSANLSANASIRNAQPLRQMVGEKTIFQQRPSYTPLSTTNKPILSRSSTDTHGRVDYLNPRAELLTGHSSRQALGLPIEDVFPIVNEESRKSAADPVQRC